ncbi:MAG: hypothetical protein JWP57_1189 [Spirosoma sp.]|nr:hypothetical protein [Spirosoma sp.]
MARRPRTRPPVQDVSTADDQQWVSEPSADQELLDGIKKAATAYQTEWPTFETKAREWVSQADDELLTGSPQTAYLKRMGHRALSLQDIEQLVIKFGNKTNQQIIKSFHQAQQQLVDRLSNTKAINLVMKQANVSYSQYYQRQKSPTLWSADQIINVVAVLERTQL